MSSIFGYGATLVAIGPVQFARPYVFLAIPVVVAIMAYLFFYRSNPERLSRRRRILFFGSRLLIVGLLITAAAGPFLVTVEETTEDPSVHLLVDESDSMAIYDVNPDAIAAGIEAQGIPVHQSTIASDTESPIGDGVIAHLERDANLLVLSDGQTTHGRSLPEAGELAFEHDARINTIELTPEATERTVEIAGPSTTSIGVEERYLVRIDGVDVGTEPVDVVVTIDDEPVLNETVEGRGDFEFEHEFGDAGEYRMTAEIASDDVFSENNIYRKAIRVVEPPEILYVSRLDYPFGTVLEQLYNVTRMDSIPDAETLDEYYAVVVHDVAAGDLGNVDALQTYANDGNGVIVVGGDNSFDHGGYAESPIANMLPVRMGDHDRSADIVLVIDISGSAEEELPIMQSLSLDILDQTGNQNRVGLIVFDTDAYPLVEPVPVGENRAELEDTILRLQAGGGTEIAAGLSAAETMLEQNGEVILISDGIDHPGPPQAAAQRLAERDIRVTSVGTGGTMNESMMIDIARITGGSYFQADETTKLRLLFGGEDRPFEADHLTVVDGNHFITTGVQPTADPALANEVTERDAARLLVASADGTPAVTAWRYGLGRVVTITTYGSDGSLGPLLEGPDAELLTRSTNWAIGDPERKLMDVYRVEDGRVDEPLGVEYRGPDRPSVAGLHFARTDEHRYQAAIIPTEPGYHEIEGATYAVNAPREYAAFGQSADLRRAVAMSGGEVFAPGDTEAMAEFAVATATREREIVRDLAWMPLVGALLIYLAEVSARRLQEVYGSNPLVG